MAGIAVVDSDDSTLWKFRSGRDGEIISRICAALMATVDEVGCSGLCTGGGGGAGGAGAAAAAASDSVRLGDGVFLRMESVSMSSPVVKTSSSTDVASSFDASCAVAST